MREYTYYKTTQIVKLLINHIFHKKKKFNGFNTFGIKTINLIWSEWGDSWGGAHEKIRLCSPSARGVRITTRLVEQNKKTDNRRYLFFSLVGVRWFEHPTFWSRTRRSTKLSHTPILNFSFKLRAWKCTVWENLSKWPLVVPKIVCSLFASHNFDHWRLSCSLHPPQAAVTLKLPNWATPRY